MRLPQIHRLIFCCIIFSIFPKENSSAQTHHTGYDTTIIVGAARFEQYVTSLKNKNVALICNQTSLVGKTFLADTLLSLGVHLTKLFAPEHGLRGTEDAGATIVNSTDVKTGLPVISLYGNHNKPTADDLKDVDVVLFDIQDVGVRFFTYISTMSYAMEACAKSKKDFIVLDRPNPNGFYVDGPVLQKNFTSFVGLHPVPIVYGMTEGEYAQMVNGENWLPDSLTCNLTVVRCSDYTHHSLYKLPVKPSPNLVNMQAVFLYPSTCLFEGCAVSCGRGTDRPFQFIGYPSFPDSLAHFTPKSMPGATNPPFVNQLCFGYDLSVFNYGYFESQHRIMLQWLIEFYQKSQSRSTFFTDYFDKLAGNSQLRTDIINGKTEQQIRDAWQPDLTAFKQIRKKYLLYPDFE